MEKIKTLLVDDDYLVLQDLENLIDWGSMGFQLIGRATSGKKALEIACCQEPELIITDISMPAMDGFDFVETLKKDFPNTYIIFISSYASFTYAQRAMETGIRDYILKNEITPQLLTERLHKVTTVLRASQKATREQLSEQLSSYFQFKANKEPDTSAFSRKYYFLFLSAHLPLEKLKNHFIHLKEYGKTLSDSVNQLLFSRYSHSFSTVIDEIVIVGLHSADISHASSPTAIPALARVFHQQLQSKLSPGVTIWYCKENQTLSQIRNTYQQLLPLIRFYGSFPARALMDIEKYKVTNVTSVKELFPYHVLSDNLNTPDTFFTQLDTYLTLLFDARDADSIFMLYHNLLLQMEELTGHMLSFPVKNYFNSQKEFLDFFVSCYKQVREYLQQKQFNRYSSAISAAIDYMKKNYSDNSLTIDQISAAVYLSSSRLSVLFKQETGQTVNDYLTDLRIAQAIRLLENSNYKIYEIAEKTGYKSSQYFSQIFSQRTGRRPLSFRQKKPVL